MAPISVEDFATPDIVYQIGVPPQRIDILTSITGVDFTAAWDSRLKVEIDGMQVSILGLRDLLVNKSSTGRDKDQADLPTIRRLIQQQND